MMKQCVKQTKNFKKFKFSQLLFQFDIGSNRRGTKTDSQMRLMAVSRFYFKDNF